MEIRPPLWFKMLVAPMVLLMCGAGLWLWMEAVCPQLVEHRRSEIPAVWVRLLCFWESPAALCVSLYLGQAWFYRLRADAYGLTESVGWKETRMFWSDVHSYSMEPRREQQGAERPVFRDAQGAELLHLLNALPCDNTTLERTREFWSFVQSRLPGKETPYVPCARHPFEQKNWDGKNASWKIKRIALLGLGALVLVGPLFAATMWAVAQPTLPSWVPNLIACAVVALLYVPTLVMAFIIHRERRRSKVGAEASSVLQVLEPPDLGIT